jgi:hypothetical protein
MYSVIDDANRFERDAGSGSVTSDSDPTVTWQNVNRVPFKFSHQLQNHPLFEISQLAKIAEIAMKRRKPGELSIPNDEELNKLPMEKRLAQAISRLERGSYWLKLSALQDLHPDYKDLLQEMLKEIGELTGVPLRETVTWAGLTVFMASANLLTPYHFDHDTNFLFQIKGEKDLYLFDQNDRSVLTEGEIEKFYRGYAMAGKYREEFANKGRVFRLTPGTAVHHPPLAPHMVTNGENVSISLSMFYTEPNLDKRARVYQANYCLRHLGLQPRPPGESAMSDRLKSMTMGAFTKSHPQTWDELMYSGINRVLLPYRAASWLAKRATGRADKQSH